MKFFAVVFVVFAAFMSLSLAEENYPVPVDGCPPQNGVDPVYLPDACDCKKYYMCSWGTPFRMKCPPTLYFNTAVNVSTRF